MLNQGGHYAGNQENQGKVREFKKERGESEKSHGILTDYPTVNVCPLLIFNLVAVFTEMLYSEVMENSLGSGRSHGNAIRKKVATL